MYMMIENANINLVDFSFFFISNYKYELNKGMKMLKLIDI